jgi:hypothetical protein
MAWSEIGRQRSAVPIPQYLGAPSPNDLLRVRQAGRLLRHAERYPAPSLITCPQWTRHRSEPPCTDRHVMRRRERAARICDANECWFVHGEKLRSSRRLAAYRRALLISRPATRSDGGGHNDGSASTRPDPEAEVPDSEPVRRRSGSLAGRPGRHGALALETAPTTAGTLSRGVCRRVGHPVAQRGFRDENWIQGGAG